MNVYALDDHLIRGIHNDRTIELGDLDESKGARVVSNLNGTVEIVGNEGSTEVELFNGEITILDQSGNTLASTVNGRVEVESKSGGVEARAVNGNIEISAAPVAPELIMANTTNGRIAIFVPTTTAANLDLSNGIGSIDLSINDFAVRDLAIGFSSVTAELNGGGSTIQATAVNGSISFGGQD